MAIPSYIPLYETGELKKRADILKSRLRECDICPRACGVNRFENKKGFCRSGYLVSVASFCDHHGEEPAISGKYGSGTIFFNSCNLKCIFCQNYQISQADMRPSDEIDSLTLANIMLRLQNDKKCHNINLVSPSHYVAQIVDAVLTAIPQGLRIPLVYNTNAYDAIFTLQLLDGIIDIYLPDIKYSSDVEALKYSGVQRYVEKSRIAIKEMYRQVGNLTVDKTGTAQRGLIVRHLILPNNIAGSKDSLQWLAEHVSREVTVSIMSQYMPCHFAVREPLLSRRINNDEYREVIKTARHLGLENGWLQRTDAADTYLPDFDRDGHPFGAE